MRAVLAFPLLFAAGCYESVSAKPSADPPSGRGADACSADADCAVFGDPVCIDAGCGPPCGNVVNAGPVALHRERGVVEIARRQAEAEKRCAEVICLACYGGPPVDADLSPYRARCQRGRCAVEPAPVTTRTSG